MLQREEELKTIIRTARDELMEIEDEKRARKNSSLIGKCYKYHNCYSCPTDDNDYWWMYRMVTGSDGSTLDLWQFQTDGYGRIEIELQTTSIAIGDGWIEISFDEFTKAWDELLSNLARRPTLREPDAAGPQ